MAKVSTSWKKGQSGNPKGAPKREWTWAGVLKEAAEEASKDGKTIKEHIARSLIREALQGNVLAVKAIMERMDGLPKQPMEHSGGVTITFDPSLKQDDRT